MPRPKTKRDYSNPVWVSLAFKDGTTEKAEVADFSVTDMHVILTVVSGLARNIRYVAISELRDFSFNEPRDRQRPEVELRQPAQPQTVQGVLSMSPARDALAERIRQENAKPKPRIPNPSEDQIVNAAAAGAPGVRMA